MAIVNHYILIVCVLFATIKLKYALEQYNLDISEPQCVNVHQQNALDLESVSSALSCSLY